MSEHVTISLSPEQLDLARREAERLGVSLEVYLVRLVEGGLPGTPPKAPAKKLPISVLLGIIPETAGEATDIAKDKDELIGEAGWKEHLRKTLQNVSPLSFETANVKRSM